MSEVAQAEHDHITAPPTNVAQVKKAVCADR